MTKQRAIICALDGCLADNSHRLHWVNPKHSINHAQYIDATENDYDRLDQKNIPLPYSWLHKLTKEKFKPDWEKYHSEMKNDKVNEAVQFIATIGMGSCDVGRILFVTDRPEKYRDITERWIRNSMNWRHLSETWIHENLFMRPEFLSCDFGRSLVLDKTIRNFCEKCFLESGGIYAKKQLPTSMTVQGKCQYCGTERLVSPVTLGLPARDNRPAHEVKREIYLRDIQPNYDVMFVLEADDDCARMYQELGLQVLKVMGRN